MQSGNRARCCSGSGSGGRCDTYWRRNPLRLTLLCNKRRSGQSSARSGCGQSRPSVPCVSSRVRWCATRVWCGRSMCGHAWAWAGAWAWAVAAAASCVVASLLPLEAERLHASVGGFAVMNCHLDFPFGNEIPYYLQWDKDGEAIFSWYSGSLGSTGGEGAGGEGRVAERWSGRVRRVEQAAALGLGRGSINVSAVRETDAGLYRCRVSFPNRTPPSRNNGTFYYLDVDGGNLILTPPMNITVMEGERAELECLPKEAGSTVEWFREGLPLSETPELAARTELSDNGSLVVLRASSADPGEFQCRVRSPDHHQQTAAAFLDVQYKAKVVYSPEERFLPYGKPASLDCHFMANPPLTNLRWEKDGFLFDPYNVPGVFYSRNGSLLFNQVDETHEGVYSCTPYNALGTEGASEGVRVRVQRPPALAAAPQPLYVARLGDTLALPCQPAKQLYHLPPTLTWARKDGKALPEGRHRIEEGNLTLIDIGEEERGVYVCTVSNDAAALDVETELLVENLPPRAPYNLTARATAYTLHLSWVPGHNGYEVDYNVWYRESSATEWRTMKILSRGVTEATLVGLRPATDYELRVLSQDHIGDGLFSKPIFIRTLDPDTSEEGQTAYAAVVTETSATTGGGGGSTAGGGVSAGVGAELEVTVRLIDEGALVRWSLAPDDARCVLRWYRAPDTDAPLAVYHTHHHYVLVGEVEEGSRYSAWVECGEGGAGWGALHVPEYGRLRAVAAGCAAGALLLAALAAALYLARRRLCAPRQPDKRRHR